MAKRRATEYRKGTKIATTAGKTCTIYRQTDRQKERDERERTAVCTSGDSGDAGVVGVYV